MFDGRKDSRSEGRLLSVAIRHVEAISFVQPNTDDKLT